MTDIEKILRLLSIVTANAQTTTREEAIKQTGIGRTQYFEAIKELPREWFTDDKKKTFSSLGMRVLMKAHVLLHELEACKTGITARIEQTFKSGDDYTLHIRENVHGTQKIGINLIKTADALWFHRLGKNLDIENEVDGSSFAHIQKYTTGYRISNGQIVEMSPPRDYSKWNEGENTWKISDTIRKHFSHHHVFKSFIYKAVVSETPIFTQCTVRVESSSLSKKPEILVQAIVLPVFYDISMHNGTIEPMCFIMEVESAIKD